MAELRGDRPQVQFVVDLHRVTGHRLSQSMLSRKENGGEITMCDIAAVAMMDREARGREWLAFGCWEDRTTLSESGTPGRGRRQEVIDPQATAAQAAAIRRALDSTQRGDRGAGARRRRRREG